MQLEQIMPAWFVQLGIMSWPLFVCSVLAVAITLERLLFVVKISITRKMVYQKLHDYLLEHKQESKALRDELISNRLQELNQSYFMGVNFLRLIGSISPMLGLTGTILGVISAFKVIAAQTGPVTPNLIADGLWEAMLTTAVGLLIAIPCLLLAYLYKYIAQSQLDRFCSRLNRVSTSIELAKDNRDDLDAITSIEDLAA